MKPVDTLIEARWVAPVEPEDALLEDHALVIERGRILELLPAPEARAKYAPARRHERREHLLIPGLVNAHTHAAMNLFKGLADDVPLMDWLAEHIWPAENRWVSESFVRDGTRLAVAEMLRGGTTCFADMYFFPDEAGRIASEAGMRAVIGLILIDAATVWAADIDEYLAKASDVHDAFRNDPLVATAFAPHAPYTVPDHALARVAALAEELDLPVHMHVHETAGEVTRAVDAGGPRPLERLARLGLLTPRLVAVHMTALEADEIERVAAAGAHVVHCPESNLKLASGLCRVADLLAAGVNLAIGTDGAASNNDLDMIGEMRTAAFLAKAVAGDPRALPASRALAMATLGGARAFGLERSIGSLVPGKAADVIAVDLGPLETQPVYDPVAQLVYACGRHQVSDAWVAGRQLMRERALLTLDEAELVASARHWQARLAKWQAK